MDAKLKEHRERPSTPVEILPGLTEEQAKAKAAQARQLQETKSARPEQLFPAKIAQKDREVRKKGFLKKYIN